MSQSERYEILDGLPAYGPMYIPISVNGEPFYSEGFVVKFFKSNGSSWVANFAKGWIGTNAVFDYTEHNKIIVISGGQGYLINPEEEKLIKAFGGGIKYAFRTLSKQIAVAGDLYVALVDCTGEIWKSERIGWDEIKDVKLQGQMLSGLSYDPMDSINEWKHFTVNLETREITGGSYREYFP